jgi:hypothetical protein
LSTPHLGSRRPKEGLFGFIYGKAVDYYLYLNGKTGEELGLFDEGKLLLSMSKDDEYIVPLNSFESKMLIAIPHYDLSVTFPSASITHYNPYPPTDYGSFKYQFVKHDKEDIPKYDEKLEYIVDNYNTSEIQVEMMKNLNNIQWEKIHVEFHIDGRSIQMCVHDMIIKKPPKISYLNSVDLQKISEDWVHNGLLPLIKN